MVDRELIELVESLVDDVQASIRSAVHDLDSALDAAAMGGVEREQAWSIVAEARRKLDSSPRRHGPGGAVVASRT